MNFKSFIATALIAATSVVAAPSAEAYTNLSPAAQMQALRSELKAAGFTWDTVECKDGGSYGWFSPKYKHIRVCSNVATTPAQQWKTFRHEAIHAAQYCMDPSMQTTVHKWSFVEANLSKDDAFTIIQHYEKYDWAIEAEAFTFMIYSNGYVAGLVDYACG